MYHNERERERIFLFNDALNTFYLWLYGFRHMVKDHSDSEKGNLLLPHRLLIDSQQGFFYMHHPTDRITHTTAFVTPVVEHWLEQEIAQWVHPMKDQSDDPSHHERMLYLSELCPAPTTMIFLTQCLSTAWLVWQSCYILLLLLFILNNRIMATVCKSENNNGY